MTLDRGAAAAGEQAEAFVEPTGDFARGHHAARGPRRARSPTECRRAAGRSARSRSSSSASSANPRRASAARSTKRRTAAHSTRASARRVVVGHRERAHQHQLLPARRRGPHGWSPARAHLGTIEIAPTSRAAGAMRCSQLSSTNSESLGRGVPRRCSRSRSRRVAAARRAWSRGHPEPGSRPPRPSSQNHAPSGKFGSKSAAVCSARRVLPTPPTPVSVTSRTSRAPRPCRRASSRPTKVVSCVRQVAGTLERASGGKSRGRSGCEHLEHVLRVPEIAETVLAEVERARRRRQRVARRALRSRARRRPGRRGRPPSGAPRGSGRPVVVAVALARVARCGRRSEPATVARLPALAGHRPLRVDGGADGLVRASRTRRARRRPSSSR